MNKSGQRIRKFNPGTFLSDEEVIEQFVVRKRELGIVLEVLHGNIDLPSCQHVLVVAPRGRGKTMLLARVAAELNTNDELSKCLLPVRFMEESHEILNLADFWLETLFHLARESAKHDSDLSQELRETHADLRDRWREKELADRVLAAVLDASDRLGKKLVLMVENLQSIGENVDDDFGWQLRRALQAEPQIMLFATATSRFKGLDDAEQPFFEQFRILDLEPLDTEDCRRLWQVVSGDAVTGREIRPLEILTGGSPRLLVMVAQFANHRSLGHLIEELVTLIDDHTEYFRGHLEVLASVERRVYIAVIDLWQPSNAGEIAERARKDVRTVSTLLGRLVNRGAVIVKGTGRKRMYVAAERLYSIYYKLRRERDEAAVIANLIHFMAVFYSKAELAEMSDKLIAEAAESKVIREGIQYALAKKPHVEDFSSRMAWSAIEDISNKATAHAQTTAEISLEKEIEMAFEEEAFEKVIEIIDSFVASGGVDSSSMPESLMAYILHTKAIAYEQLEDFQAVVAVCNEMMVKHFGDTCDISILGRMFQVLVHGTRARIKLGDFEAVIAAYDEVVKRLGDSDVPGLQILVATVVSERGDTQVQLGEFEAAISSYDEVIKRFGTSDLPNLQDLVVGALLKKCNIQVEIGRAEEALHICEELERRRDILSKDETIWFEWQTMFMRTRVLMALKKYREALEAFRLGYAASTLNDEVTMQAIQLIVLELIVKGALERDLIEILSSDKEKSDALVPLIVVLRLRAGEEVRAPVEVLEVAKDINKDIDAKMAN